MYHPLEDIPFKLSCVQLTRINPLDYVAIAFDTALPLWIYKSHSNRWIPLVFTEFGGKFGYVRSATFDPQTKLLYVARDGNHAELMIIDISDPQNPMIRVRRTTKTFAVCRLVIIGDDIHILGHFIGNSAANQLALQHIVFYKSNLTLKSVPGRIDGHIESRHNDILVKSRNSLIIFGCDRNGNDRVIEYSLTTNQYRCCQWMKPSTLNVIGGVVISEDERYVIFFGGERRWERANMMVSLKTVRTIIICDLKTGIIRESALRCPLNGYFRGIMMNDPQRDELMTFGFVNRMFRMKALQNVQPLPRYLVQMIGHFVASESIHLASKNGGHWKVELDDILKCI